MNSKLLSTRDDLDDAINAAADESQRVQAAEGQPTVDDPAPASAVGVGAPGPMINDAEDQDALPDDGPKDVNNQNPY